MSGFAALAVRPELLAAVAALGYVEMTPIQAAALPAVLAGRDVIAQARTGSGKTLAFGLGLLQRVDAGERGPQALVLCPTRELADQVAGELRRLARTTANLKVLVLCGGVPLGPQIASLRHGAHVVVGTPGRVGKHVRDGRLELGDVRVVVLDEGDRLLDMGFGDEVTAIVHACAPVRQTLLFSATFPPEITRMSAALQRDALRIAVDEAHDASHVEQAFYEVGPAGLAATIVDWLSAHRPARTLVFCNTKLQTAALARELGGLGVDALALHGDLEQPDRDRILAMFDNGSVAVLVATDVAARGLDLAGLDAVVHAELPLDAEVYVHRTGRTGRAGRGGLAMGLVTPESLGRLHAIERFCGITATLQRAPEPGPDGPPRAGRVTLCVWAGRKDKLRPGDVLGALTRPGGLAAAHVGKIDVGERVTYVAIDREHGAEALAHLQRVAIKGRRLRVTKAG